MRRTLHISLCVLAVLASSACRGNKSGQPPIHFQQNMDHQKRVEAQEANAFYKDNRGMREQVPGTVARGELKANTLLYTGKRGGKPSVKFPGRITPQLLARGQERFDIYCAPCHGRAGDGKGPVAERGIAVKPTSYMEPRLYNEPIGHFFDVITNGIRNMPPLGHQIPPQDRWAISAYVRALQIAGRAKADQVPVAIRQKRGWK